jgi:hypothetical protein
MTMKKKAASEMIKHKQKISDSNEQGVLNAVSMLGTPKPRDIKKYLQNEKKKEIQMNEWKNNNMRIMSENELSERVEKEAISMRTILRKLVKLHNEGWLEHKDSRYSIKDKLKADIRLFAPQFGRSALSNMMKQYNPSLHTTFERNLDEMIKLFGVYMIYCFTEAARPTLTTSNLHNTKSLSHITKLDRDKLASFWVQNVFSPLDMYNYFLAVMENQKEKGTGTKEKHKHQQQPPWYELDSKIIENISNVLEKNYRPQYEPLLETSSYFLRGPKANIINVKL